MPSPHRSHTIRRGTLLGAVALTGAALFLGACTSDSDSGTTTATTAPALPADAQSIIDSAPWQFGQWNYQAVDMDTGETVYAGNPDTLGLIASNTKNFTVGAYLETFGIDATVETPVYALGERAGSTLQGDLVIVGAGDFILGSRGVPNGELQYNSPDHVYAYASPLAKPVAADPLAGLNTLAAQVAAAGITTVDGDVLVDDRLWEPFETKEGVVTPLTVNDNLLDIQLRAGTAAGEPASLTAIPTTAYFEVINEVTTVAADGEADVTAEVDAANRVVVRGEVPVGAEPYNTAVFAPDPSAYARALFIEALGRAGVTISASLTTSPTTALPAPGTYAPPAKVASLTSPPSSTFAKLVQKVSHNRGAETLLCLMAVKAGSTDCKGGVPTIIETISASGAQPGTVFVYDGEGTDPASATPAAMVRFLTWADQQPWAAVYRDAMPDLNNDQTIQVKSGTSGQGQNPPMNALFPVNSESGYLTTASGKRLAVSFLATNGSWPTVAEGLAQGGPGVKEVLKQIQADG
jgi:D-alanyl-D-alanine carboxypeptidase/D-alanyl-D-alanine-endopeptidase (penicillin-binding protein 4)